MLDRVNRELESDPEAPNFNLTKEDLAFIPFDKLPPAKLEEAVVGACLVKEGQETEGGGEGEEEAEKPSGCEISLLHVVPDECGLGLALLLVDCGMEAAKDKGFKEMTIKVRCIARRLIKALTERLHFGIIGLNQSGHVATSETILRCDLASLANRRSELGQQILFAEYKEFRS